MASVSSTSEALRELAADGFARVRRTRIGRCPACHAAVRGDDRLALIGRRVGHAECAAITRDRRGRSSLRLPPLGPPPLVGD